MRFLCVVIILWLTALAPIQAAEVQWRGFAAQGVIGARDSNFVEDDGGTSFRLTEVGINASSQLTPRLRLNGQAVYLNGGNRFSEGARVDYLFLDWRALDVPQWQVNLQVGRYKNYNWLYSATRDVPHTRPSIILPQSVYFDVFRNVALGNDGVAMLVDHYNDAGDWQFVWNYGRSAINEEQKKNLMGPAATGDIDQDFAHLMSLYWQPNNHRWRYGVSLLDSDFDYQRGDADVLVDGTATTQRLMLSAMYSGERWELAFEGLRERVRFENVLFPGFSSDTTAEGGYVQARYFWSDRLTLLSRLDLFDVDRSDRSGTRLSARSGGMIPEYFAYMDQLTFGASLDLAPHWRVQAEFHRVRGRGRLAPVLTPDVSANHGKYWDIWALQVMHWF